MRRLICTLSLVLAFLATIANIAPAAAAAPLSVSAPSAVAGGRSVSVTILLAKAAPAGGTTVELSSSDRDALPIAKSLDIRAGRSSGSVSVRTRSVEKATPVTITVQTGSTEKSVTVTVLPAKLASFSTPSTIVGGAVAKGTVSRDVASTYPTTVKLASKDPAVLSVPETVTIKANASSASFPITTSAERAGTVTVVASVDGKSLTDSTKVTSAQLSRVSIPASLSAGATRTAKVYLTGPAPDGGSVVSLTSSDDRLLSLPSKVVVAGGASETSFQVVAGIPSAATKVTVTARLNDLSVARSTTVSAGTQPVAIASVDGAPEAMLSGDANGNAKVVLTKSTSSATTVQLSSSDRSALGVPATVVVPAGKTSVAFTMVAGGVTGRADVTVTATLPSGARSVTIAVLPATLVSVETTPELASGSSATGTITLDGIAPEGAVVKLRSSEPKLIQIPEAVALTAGATGATFAITTGTVSEATKFELVAYYADQKVSFTGVLLPAPVVGPSAFDPASFTYVPDTETVLTLLLTGPAPADGLTVGLEYSEGVSGDGKVWVEAGATSVTTVIWAKSGLGSVSVVAYANDMKAVAAGTAVKTTATLTVERAELTGGETIVATLTLSAPAGPDGVGIVIASDYPEIMPGVKLYLAPGETSITFKVETSAVKKGTRVTLSTVEGPAASVTVVVLRKV